MSEYAKPFSGKDQREFARRRSVMNSLRAAKIRERRAARKAGDHGKDAAILMQGEKMGIPFGGVASAENLDQLALSGMSLDKQIDDRRGRNRTDMRTRSESPSPVVTPKADRPPSQQETNINVVDPDDDVIFGWMERNPDKVISFAAELLK